MKAHRPNITCSDDGNIKAYSTYNNILITFKWPQERWKLAKLCVSI